MKFEDFKEFPVQEISIEDLSKTHLEHYPDGTPVGGIYHYELISKVLDMLAEAGFGDCNIQTFVANNNVRRNPGITILPDIEKQEGVGALSAHICRRVFSNINIVGNGANDESCYNMAISYTQAGIMFGFGPFVYACKNQTICRAERIISNYTIRGFEKVSNESRRIDVLMSLVSDQIHSIAQNAADDFNEVELLKTKMLNHKDMFALLGEMVVIRAACASPDPLVHMNSVAPLSSADINVVADNLLSEKLIEEGCSAYDFLQHCNKMLKPRTVPFENIAPQAYNLYYAVKDYVANYL